VEASRQLPNKPVRLMCRGETWLSELLDRHAAAGGSPAEQARTAGSCLGLDLRTDEARQEACSGREHCPQ